MGYMARTSLINHSISLNVLSMSRRSLEEAATAEILQKFSGHQHAEDGR